MLSKGLRLFSRYSITSTAFLGLLAQGIRPLFSLITLPLLMKYLGQEGVGVWMTALSMMGLISFAGAGISASTVTAISRASIQSSKVELSQSTASAMLIAAVYGLIILILIIPFAILMNWNSLFGLNDKAIGHNVSYLIVSLTIVQVLGLVASIPQQIMIGQMHGYFSHAIGLIGGAIGVISLIFAMHFNAPLWALAVALMGAPVFLSAIVGLIYLNQNSIDIFSIKNYKKSTTWGLLKNCFTMAGYQGAYAFSSQSDLVLIGIFIGASATTSYGVAHRVFSFLIVLSATINYAQWPMMSRWEASMQHEKIEKLMYRTLFYSVIINTILAAAVAYFYQALIKIWLGSEVNTDSLILIGMIAWVLVATMANVYDSVLRARNEVKFMMRCMLLMSFINIGATLILLPILGSSGAIFGSVCGYFIAVLIPYAMYLRKILNSSKNECLDN